MKFYFFAISLLFSAVLHSQKDSIKTKFHWLELSGFISNSMKYDTRQSVTAREGEIYLYPKPIDLDKFGNDRNGFGKLQMFNLHSRMRWKVKGPKLGNFKTSGTLAFDFVGTTNVHTSTARLRHAFVSISGEKLDFMIGQNWHPTFIPECYPEVIAWGAAIPMQPFSRSPQISITYRPVKTLSITAAALSQRDFSNSGPNGSSGEYLRNSGIPELQFKIMLKSKSNFLLGATAGYKVISPRLETDSLIANKETVSSYNLGAFAKYKTDNFYLKIHTTYGQSLDNLLMLGGYMVDKIDVENDIRTYKSLSVFSYWGETAYTFGNFSIGFFAGVVEAPDNEEAMQSEQAYGLGTNISSVYKWSPRIVYKKEKLQFGVELAATTASYIEHSVNNQMIPAHDVTNYRTIFSTVLFF